MCILPRAIYTFDAIPIKIPLSFLKELEQIILKICVEPQKALRSQNSLEKEIQSNTIPDFKLYYKAVVIKIVWYWHKYRHIDRGKKIEIPETNSQLYDLLIFRKRGKNMQWERRVSSTTCIGKIGQLCAKEWNWTTFLHQTQKQTQNGLRICMWDLKRYNS